MTLYTDDELQRSKAAVERALRDPDSHGREGIAVAVLDATLPAIRQRWLRELADEWWNPEHGAWLPRDETAAWLRRKADEVTP